MSLEKQKLLQVITMLPFLTHLLNPGEGASANKNLYFI